MRRVVDAVRRVVEAVRRVVEAYEGIVNAVAAAQPVMALLGIQHPAFPIPAPIVAGIADRPLPSLATLPALMGGGGEAHRDEQLPDTPSGDDGSDMSLTMAYGHIGPVPELEEESLHEDDSVGELDLMDEEEVDTSLMGLEVSTVVSPSTFECLTDST